MAVRAVAIDSAVLRRVIGVGIGIPPIARVRNVVIQPAETEGKRARRVISKLEVNHTTVPELRGHFPSLAIMPAIVMLEAIFQSTAAAAVPHAQLDIGRIKSAAFRKPIVGLGALLQITIDSHEDGGNDGSSCKLYRATVKERNSDEIAANVEFYATEILD